MSEYKKRLSVFSDIKRPIPHTHHIVKYEYQLPREEMISSPDVSFEVFKPKKLHRKETKAKKGTKYLLSRNFFLLSCLVIVLLFIGYRGAKMRTRVVEDGNQGFQNISLAVQNIKASNFEDSTKAFRDAYQSFSSGTDNLFVWGGPLLNITRFIPGLSTIASGKYALEAGQHFALAGIPLTHIVEELSVSKDAYDQGEKISWLDFLASIDIPLTQAQSELEAGDNVLQKIKIDDVPEEKRDKFLSVKKNLPLLLGLLKNFDNHEVLLKELLGANGPRKYLFLLQNNQEMRATGGFIGTYALMDVENGRVKRFFVDGIFNPDGQLKENIVPPKPIQKVSATWSLHDSNWFPDFPASAEKAIFFYEKTGGPTVDGVITLTPTVMQKLLRETGPIDLPEYGFTVNSENFVTLIQDQVETKYDKEENKPKKVLADLTVLLIEKVFASQDKETFYRIANALVEGLNEKQILLYMRHEGTEALIDEAGWSGKILPTSKDYVSVIHSNINGYKTDGVIDETINHTAEISEDGSIVDTLSITRTHHGGNTPYEWWNKVNADYMRVYVPKGSVLLSTQGATWEFPSEPLDYKALGFRVDADVAKEESSITIDEKTGTRISVDADKTVFGAWVYVSPKESVTVEYRYRLPFSLDTRKMEDGGVDSYTVLYQKQSGSVGSNIVSSILFPRNMESVWQMNGNLIPYERQWKFESQLKTDVFSGIIFTHKQ